MNLIKLIALFLPFLFSFSAAQPAPKKLVLTFFGSPTCEECLTIENTLLKPIETRYAPALQIHYRNVDDAKDFNVLTAMEKGYAVKSTAPQELFFPDTVLVGYEAIMKTGEKLIGYYVSHPEKWAYYHALGDTTIDTGNVK
jgi:hypothetical protein